MSECLLLLKHSEQPLFLFGADIADLAMTLGYIPSGSHGPSTLTLSLLGLGQA